MAFLENKTTGKAIAAVKGVYFYKHDENSDEPIMEDVLDATNPESNKWFAVLTLRGTVNVSQDAPSIEKILVDQFDAPIGITTEPGDFTFEAQLPSLDEDDLAQWMEDIDVISGKGIRGKQLVGINLDGRIIETSVLIETATGAFIAFTNCQVVLSFMKEDKVFGIRMSGQVLAAEKKNNKMIYLATKKMVVPVSGITLNKSILTLAVGAEETLEATIAPDNASNKKVTWSSSDPTKATVDANSGKVTGVAPASGSNKVTITATSVADDSFSDTCEVTVTAA